MTPETFRSRLAALGLTLHRFCVLADIHPSTASSWGKQRGETTPPFPGWVGRLLSAWEALGRVVE